MELTNGELFDLVINCVNIENTEMASILACKDDGTVYFFSMATSFTKAALGAEGVCKDVNMIIGNCYTKGHEMCIRDRINIVPLHKICKIKSINYDHRAASGKGSLSRRFSFGLQY